MAAGSCLDLEVAHLRLNVVALRLWVSAKLLQEKVKVDDAD